MDIAYISLLAIETQSRIIEFTSRTLFELGMQFLNTFVIIFILYKLLFKPMTEFLEKRRAGIEKDLADAANAKSEAEDLKVNYTEKISNIEAEATEILKEARAKALVREEEIIKQAKEEAEAIRQKAKEDINLEKEQIKDDLKQETIQVATLMASKFIKEELTEDKQKALIDETIKEMGDVQWLN